LVIMPNLSAGVATNAVVVVRKAETVAGGTCVAEDFVVVVDTSDRTTSCDEDGRCCWCPSDFSLTTTWNDGVPANTDAAVRNVAAVAVLFVVVALERIIIVIGRRWLLGRCKLLCLNPALCAQVE